MGGVIGEKVEGDFDAASCFCCFLFRSDGGISRIALTGI